MEVFASRVCLSINMLVSFRTGGDTRHSQIIKAILESQHHRVQALAEKMPVCAKTQAHEEHFCERGFPITVTYWYGCHVLEAEFQPLGEGGSLWQVLPGWRQLYRHWTQEWKNGSLSQRTFREFVRSEDTEPYFRRCLEGSSSPGDTPTSSATSTRLTTLARGLFIQTDRPWFRVSGGE